jgi:hypothetical protein
LEVVIGGTIGGTPIPAFTEDKLTKDNCGQAFPPYLNQIFTGTAKLSLMLNGLMTNWNDRGLTLKSKTGRLVCNDLL